MKTKPHIFTCRSRHRRKNKLNSTLYCTSKGNKLSSYSTILFNYCVFLILWFIE